MVATDQAPMRARWIIHVDLDAFFASVEALLDPSLRGKAVIVGGAPEGRGVVASASYEARRYGVRSAMPMAQALRLCPHAIRVPARHGVYGEHSRRVMAILHDITPAVEQISIDEAFLDVTGCEQLWGPVETIGELIRRRVRDECHLPVSLGIAPSKLVAKIACDLGKPQGMVIVRHGEEQSFLAPLPVERLWGVGHVTAERLRTLRIITIGDVAQRDEAWLAERLGDLGRDLAQKARGVDPSPVQVEHERRSISQEETFAHDVIDRTLLLHELLRMSEALASRLRADHLVCETVRIKLRYPDLRIETRQTRLSEPTDQAPIISAAAQALLTRYLPRNQPLRLLGLGVSGLLEQGGYQLNLLDHTDQKRILLDRAVDDIRDRYGRDAITRASLLRDQGAEED